MYFGMSGKRTFLWFSQLFGSNEVETTQNHRDFPIPAGVICILIQTLEREAGVRYDVTAADKTMHTLALTADIETRSASTVLPEMYWR